MAIGIVAQTILLSSMPSKAPKAALAAIRKGMKAAAGIVRGASCAVVERHVTTASISLAATLTDAELEQAAIDSNSISHEVYMKHSAEPAIRRREPKPDQHRHWTSVAFDKYVVAHGAELNTLLTTEVLPAAVDKQKQLG